MKIDFHEKLRHGFLDIAAQDKDRCVVVDALQPPQTVYDMIWERVRHAL